MKLVNNASIQVLNYSPTPVALKGQNREYLVPRAGSMGPGVEFLDATDVKYINGRSPVFKDGILEFTDDEREEIYEELHMPNWKDMVLFERDIDKILTNPTKESLERIVAIRSVQMIERIRGHMIGLINAKEDVSSRVINLVNERTDELRRNASMPSKIRIVEKDYAVPVDEQVVSLKQEIAELKALLLAANESKKEEPVAEEVVKTPPPAKKTSPKPVTKKTPSKPSAKNAK